MMFCWHKWGYTCSGGYRFRTCVKCGKSEKVWCGWKLREPVCGKDRTFNICEEEDDQQ